MWSPFDDRQRDSRGADMPGFLKYIIFLNMLGMLSGIYTLS
ncbi:hypothetical protein [Nocardia sp. NPDC051750]